MKLLLALGNPGPHYAGTRHNTGFFVADQLAGAHGATFSDKPKFKAHIAEVTIAGEKVLIAKPTTFYNEVGQAMRAIADFYKLAPSDVLVIHDDLALPLGTLRTRIGGSGGGNNGIKSVNAHGGAETHRLRIGVYNELRDTVDDVEFVLGRFNADERAILEQQLPTITTIITDFCSGTINHSTHRHATE